MEKNHWVNQICHIPLKSMNSSQLKVSEGHNWKQTAKCPQYFWTALRLAVLGPVAASGFSPAVEGSSFSPCWLPLLQSTGSRLCQLRQPLHTGPSVVAHWLSCSKARGIFPTREGTTVSHTVWRILNHWTTREAQHLQYYTCKMYF